MLLAQELRLRYERPNVEIIHWGFDFGDASQLMFQLELPNVEHFVLLGLNIG